MRYKQSLLILFLVLAGFGTWVVLGAFGNDSQSVAATNNTLGKSFLPFDYIKEDPIIMSELDEAKLQAKSWSADAELVAISMRFEDGIGYSYLGHYNYIFSSPDEPGRYWIVSSPRVDGTSDQTYTSQDLFGDVTPATIKKEYMKINFVQALEIVERSGGYEFRLNRPGDYSANLLLVKPESGVLDWHVSYSGDGGSEMSWRVNAANGLLEIE